MEGGIERRVENVEGPQSRNDMQTTRQETITATAMVWHKQWNSPEILKLSDAASVVLRSDSEQYVNWACWPSTRSKLSRTVSLSDYYV